MNSAKTHTSSPVLISPVSKAGIRTFCVDQPSTHASATVSTPKSTAPSVATVKMRGSRLMPTQRTRKPSSVVVPFSSASVVT